MSIRALENSRGVRASPSCFASFSSARATRCCSRRRPRRSPRRRRRPKRRAEKLPPDQLDSLVAPIALYPDPLLAQTLVASTYPLEIIQLQQWLAKNPNLKDKALADAVAKEPWDPAIQSMAAVPEVVKRLADDIQWTTQLGNAFLDQQGDVMDAVQRMRKKAEEKGALESNEQQKVETKVVEEKTVIVVQPTNPEVIYVPSYNPTVVYGAADLSLSAGLLPALLPRAPRWSPSASAWPWARPSGAAPAAAAAGAGAEQHQHQQQQQLQQEHATSAVTAAGTTTGSTTPSTAAGPRTRTRRRRTSTADPARGGSRRGPRGRRRREPAGRAARGANRGRCRGARGASRWRSGGGGGDGVGNRERPAELVAQQRRQRLQRSLGQQVERQPRQGQQLARRFQHGIAGRRRPAAAAAGGGGRAMKGDVTMNTRNGGLPIGSSRAALAVVALLGAPALRAAAPAPAQKTFDNARAAVDAAGPGGRRRRRPGADGDLRTGRQGPRRLRTTPCRTGTGRAEFARLAREKTRS